MTQHAQITNRERQPARGLGRPLASLLLGMALVALAPPASAGTDILENGGFEIGPAITGGSYKTLGGGSTAISGWTVTGSSIDYIGPGWVVGEGTRAVDLDGAFATGGIQQSFATEPGLAYEVSFAFAGNPGGGPSIKSVRVSVAGVVQDFSIDTSGQVAYSPEWESRSLTIVAGSATATLSFTSLSSAGSSWGALIDDVVVAGIPSDAWSDEGCALAGAAGEPSLVGSGPMTAGSLNSLELSGAAPSAMAGLFLAASSSPIPFMGGTLKPHPFVEPLIFSTSAAGAVSLAGALPAGLPAGTEVWAQWAIVDAGAIQGVALSNAIVGVAP